MADDADDGKSGALDGGSSKDGQDNEPKDVIPKSQFLAALKSAEEKREREVAELRAEFEAKLAKATEKPAEQAKRYTRAELNAAVAANQITQDQADQQIDNQIREDARTIARETVNLAQRTESVSSQINQYVTAVPDLKDKTSDTYGKVTKEFRFLVSNGSDPKNLGTELAAIRAALGPIEAVRAARSGRTSHEPHQEIGGDGGAGPRGGQGGLKLSPREKAHYQKLIDRGTYADWKAVEEERKYAKAGGYRATR